MKFKLKALAVAAVASISTVTFADETPSSPHAVTGNIGILSSYVLRGNTKSLENKGATVNGGLDYEHESGFYAGWWGSTLDYDLDGSEFENDFYFGYNGSFNDDWGYSLGLAYYYYYDIGTSESDGFESKIAVNYKDLSVTAQTLLEDTSWGNTGDTYISGAYSYALPRDFSLNTTLGLYYNNDNGDYEGESFDTKDDFNFRHFNIGLSKSIGETGVTANMDYVIGGKLRDGTDLKNKVVLGLAYSF